MPPLDRATLSPPRLARCLLAVVPRGRRDEIVAELDADFRARSAGSGIGISAHRWYWSQVLRSVPPLLWEESRSWWGWGDLRRAALRAMRGWRAFVFGVAPLAVAVVSTSLTFELVQAAWIEAMPYARPGELLAVGVRPTSGAELGRLSPLDLDLARETVAEDGEVGAYYAPWSVTLIGDPPALLRAAAVSAETFRVLGAGALHGRMLEEQDFAADAAPAAVLDHEFWLRRFGGAPEVVGELIRLGPEGLPFGGSITVGGEAVRIVGVAERPFRIVGQRADLYLPLPQLGYAWRDSAARSLYAVARVAPAGHASVQQRLAAREVAGEGPEFRHLGAQAFETARLQRTRIGLSLVAACCLMFMALAGFNAASFVLVQSRARRADLEVRRALGASRFRQRWLALLDATVLVSSAIVVGAAAASLAARSPWFAQAAMALSAPVRAPGFAAIATTAAITTLFLGTPLAFALRSSRRRRDSGRLQHLLVRGLVVGSTVLLAFALAGMAGFARYLGTDTGVDTNRAHGFTVTLSRWNIPQADRRAQTFATILSGLRAIPGTRSVAATSRLPLSDAAPSRLRLKVDGPAEASRAERVVANAISEDFFETLSIEMVDGAEFEDARVLATPERLAIVNAAFAQRYLPAGEAIGALLRRVDAAGEPTDAPPMRVIGVATTVRDQQADVKQEPEVYLHFSQFHYATLWIVLRSSFAAEELHARVQRTIRAIDPTVMVRDFRSLDDLVLDSVRLEWRLTHAIAILAVLTLMMATFGTYGLMAEATAQRLPEIGVRRAMGAPAGRIVADSLRVEMAGMAIAIACGAVIGWAGLRAIGSISAVVSEPSLTIAAASQVVIGLAAGIAISLPCLRATRTEPAVLIYGRR